MKTIDMALRDISPDWTGSTPAEQKITTKLIRLQKMPAALFHFSKNQGQLSNYWYWFLLSTLWVNYNGMTELATWRRLFASQRPNRLTSIMKPSELAAFKQLPETVTAFRAHRVGEQDWIAYTLNPERAVEFAHRREVGEVMGYEIPSAALLALFLRRGESEVLLLDRSQAKPVAIYEIPK